MSCDKFEKQISLYVDDELSPEDRKAFEEHIAECEQCSQQLQAISFMRNMMGKAEEKEIKLPNNMKRKIYLKIYRDLLILFTGLVIIISMISISGGLAQMLLFDRIPIGIRIFFIAGMALLVSGLIILVYDILIDMFKIITRK